MFRIGFDPFLDAEIQHEELIKDMEGLRLAKLAEECGKPRKQGGSKILAQLGRSLSFIGTSLTVRYGDKIEKPAELNPHIDVIEC